jgi:hypothetical protein
MQGNGTGDSAGRLAQVQRLATELAAKVRYAQIVARAIPPEQIAALVEAARLLQERGEPWPPLVGEVLQRVVDDMERPAEAEPVEGATDAEAEAAVANLTRFGEAFRRDEMSAGDPDRT